MKVVTKSISIDELKKMSEKMFGRIVKAVVDLGRDIMVVDAELQADQEEFLLEEGSKQEHLWGINFHPDKFGTSEFIEFDSMINLRPSWGSKSRSVDDAKIQEKIRGLVDKMVVQ